MKGFQFIVSGSWAHFKKPETNNNPLTHDFITKTALIGMIGAVLGIERQDMKPRFPEFSEDFLYGVQLINPVKKISWGFSSRTAFKPTESGSPKYFEFLRNPCFLISLALQSPRSETYFNDFLEAVQQSEAVFMPVLGWHNCPANLNFVSEGDFHLQQGSFAAKCFIEPEKHTLTIPTNLSFRIGLERIPTYQNADFWNLPEKYVKVAYPDAGNCLEAAGEHCEYSIDNQKWVLI